MTPAQIQRPQTIAAGNCMKIVFFTDTYSPQINGVVSYINDIIDELKKENELVLFAPSSDKKMKIEQKDKNFKIYWIPSSPFPFYEGYLVASANYKRISNIIEKEKPDIVHAHIPVWLGLQGIISAKRKKIPIVITYHTHLPEYAPHLIDFKNLGILKKLTQDAVKKLIKHTYAMANVVTAPTEELAQELKGYGLKNVICLSNGVNFKRLLSNSEKVAQIKHRHKLENKQIVLYLGRLSFEKRIDKLIDAYKLIETPKTLLVIAGSGPNKNNLIEYAKKIGVKNIVFTGQIPHNEIGSTYEIATIFASASDSETFGLTFVEAMHFGIPPIGTNRLGVKEVIQNNISGILIEPNDTTGFARAMETLLRNQKIYGRISVAAKKRAAEYSIENSATQLVKTYQNLIN